MILALETKKLEWCIPSSEPCTKNISFNKKLTSMTWIYQHDSYWVITVIIWAVLCWSYSTICEENTVLTLNFTNLIFILIEACPSRAMLGLDAKAVENHCSGASPACACQKLLQTWRLPSQFTLGHTKSTFACNVDTASLCSAIIFVPLTKYMIDLSSCYCATGL